MIIKKACPDQYLEVRAFYHSLIDGIEDQLHSVGWKKDIYPAPDFLMKAISEGELYIGTENGGIIASMVLDHQCNDSYRNYRWPAEAADDEVTVIHAFGVHPSRSRSGYGRQMVQFAIDTARASQQKVIRLDVLKGNVPAEKLYTGTGFRYLHTLPMYYEDTGWTDFDLYEYIL